MFNTKNIDCGIQYIFDYQCIGRHGLNTIFSETLKENGNNNEEILLIGTLTNAEKIKNIKIKNVSLSTYTTK